MLKVGQPPELRRMKVSCETDMHLRSTRKQLQGLGPKLPCQRGLLRCRIKCMSAAATEELAHGDFSGPRDKVKD